MVLNKKKTIIICFLLLLVFIGVLLIRQFQDKGIVYDYNSSFHHDFYYSDSYVVFKTLVKVKNITDKDLYFYMYADVSEDYGLVIEKTAVACKKDSLEKEKFFLSSKSEKIFDVYFKAKKGSSGVKKNRLPPKDIRFDIINGAQP